ncbi:MAG: thymidine kinase [Sphingobacteriales bacterium 17-39-43]|jgi:thymidine kinase|uniref:thymidine kinase n=1 Tax=Daejeonella sp. TaxID=2805397 RepID=UPI000BDDAF6E|nr:thymidine kinase [Daejeonella sp.]MCF8453392.1 thymidine kinase [Pedobacter sp.]OYZ30638.1 MAG: thymidine kinase [Sphingobacteriales bacterium 16-39-50]OYZ53894.1 MAG: thymidine kinase [Sphingobacteriales bacterium 24-40-4]OZA23359.1 MAG: thymidine kinase [Sphingobacteriales bacterium 17-39-43]HQS05429.1 thymidine kinase [Daejeonella sp.]
MLFSEHNFKRRKELSGSIEVICGSMFSGKTEELIRRLRRAQIAKLNVEIFKPKTDTRYDENSVVSHDLNSIQSTPVENAASILLLSSNTEVVGIDEAQFFDDQLPDVCNTLANRGIRVIIAGLDMDFQGKPFGPMPELMSIAEVVNKVHAVCLQCGGPATYSYRTVPSESKILLGEKESYEPRCRTCFNTIS